MNFLNSPPRFLFYTGKGGVGKTSLSCATAVALADAGKMVLLVSTDPASNVGQVFNQKIGNTVMAVESVPGLSALEINPQEAASLYRARIIDPVRDALPEEALRNIEEQLSGACTTEIAAFDEFTSLLTDDELISRYDHIIFDTAPTGHTIRLLQLPGAWSKFIESNPEGASCLGPLSGLEKQRDRYLHALDVLSDAERTRLILVARAQTTSLIEVARTQKELSDVGLKNQYLVVNGVYPDHACAGDVLAEAIVHREQEALADLPGVLSALPCDRVKLQPANIVGISALRQLILPETDYQEKVDVQEREGGLSGLPSLASLTADIAKEGHGLIMIMGKGGVGKTTLAAAVAVNLAEKGLDVHLTTSDPAAHVETTLRGTLASLRVSRIDPEAETARYRRHIMDTRGKDLDARGRALLEEDLRSPCTEEIAVFQAFSRVIREAAVRFVVMDTAPTGHTLLLLDATGAYHREIARKMGKTAHFTTPMMQLQDPKRTKILLATLPETTPVLEAAALQEDLRRAGIEPWSWVINNSMAAAKPSSALLRRRAKNELPEIMRVRDTLANRVALVPVQKDEPVGIAKLKALSGK